MLRDTLDTKLCITFLFIILLLLYKSSVAKSSQEAVTFRIKDYIVEGNTLFDNEEIERVISEYKGEDKTAEDVEKARSVLEALYHKKGYPTVLVNIPEQTLEEGLVKLQVIESKIRRLKITGNRFVTRKKILRQLTSFHPGEILFFPKVKKELALINRSQDLEVSPILIPGKELGTLDIELKVKDRLPLHGSLEINNRSTHTTTDLRATATLRYDDLWQRDHSITLQYQTSPEDTDEVQTLFISYVLSSPWNFRHMMAFYFIESDSETSALEEIRVIGKGKILGLRYIIPLPAHNNYQHNTSLGVDYKDFDEIIGFQDEDDEFATPIQYLPFSLGYSASMLDSKGTTYIDTSLNMVFRGLITEKGEFEAKSGNDNTKGNYLFLTAAVERVRRLPGHMELFLKMDGQLANQPLISNEQYSAGGMESLRGYKESEEFGDNAIHLTLEIHSPNFFQTFGFWEENDLTLYGFYDGAILEILKSTNGSSDEEEREETLQGAGIGIMGRLGKRFEYGLDLGFALEKTDQTDKGSSEIHFSAKYQF